jgi:hypothetical protein
MISNLSIGSLFVDFLFVHARHTEKRESLAEFEVQSIVTHYLFIVLIAY